MKNKIILYSKGIAMGAADSVPGVSGGTIAFISGIYEELIDTIRSFDPEAVKLLFQFNIRQLWQHINGTFLVTLLAGIGTSILLLSRIILHWLAHYPELLWAFFFGLVAASALVVSKKISQWNAPIIISGILGLMFGYAITVIVPAQTPDHALFVFLSGMIAICAMILPGISGSFILVLLSKYEYVLTAVKDFNLTVILIFGSGCGIGILAFSHLLSWMLKKYHDLTIALLTGIMIGSLNKVWPWKLVVETYTNSKGHIKPLITENILPFGYLETTGRDPFLVWAVVLAVFGFFLVYGLEKISVKDASPTD